MSRRQPSASAPAPTDEPETKHLFLNRELSWLAFNERVLAETCDKGVPLGERFKFQSIVASNLDEFFMVRVAGLKQMVAGGVVETGADGLLPSEQMTAIASRAQAMVSTLYQNWRDEIAPGLAGAGLAILRPSQLAPEQRAFLEGRFRKDIWPVLTPLAVDQGHPFPVLRNASASWA